MTQSPKEKAAELVDEYLMLVGSDWNGKAKAKQCAIIAVDEIEKALGKADTAYDLLPSIEYWQQVRSEIENMYFFSQNILSFKKLKYICINKNKQHEQRQIPLGNLPRTRNLV